MLSRPSNSPNLLAVPSQCQCTATYIDIGVLNEISTFSRPHKVAVCKLVDELTEEARAIGASNTIYFKTGQDGKRKLVGHNTEFVANSKRVCNTRY